MKHEAAARSAQAQGSGGVMLVLLAEKGQRLLMTEMSEKSIFTLCELVFCNVCAPHSEPEEEKQLVFQRTCASDGFTPEVTFDGCKGRCVKTSSVPECSICCQLLFLQCYHLFTDLNFLLANQHSKLLAVM